MGAESTSRLRQIEEALRQSHQNEEQARKGLAVGTDLSPEVALRFIVERLELYNEEARIQSGLIRSRAATEAADHKMLSLAKQLDLHAKIRKDRPMDTAKEGCWTACTDCVTNCGLDGDNFGSKCVQGSIVSSCKPKPNF